MLCQCFGWIVVFEQLEAESGCSVSMARSRDRVVLFQIYHRGWVISIGWGQGQDLGYSLLQVLSEGLDCGI
jgi:hypothetical protein